jgi:hypothetical protein
MWSDLVVYSASSLQLLHRICKRQGPVRVQALGPEAAIEGLDERRLRVVSGHCGCRGQMAAMCQKRESAPVIRAKRPLSEIAPHLG